jgi:hypothetical protein
MLGRQGVAYPGNMVREDECAGGQMIGKIGRQNVKIRGLLLRPSRAKNPAVAERIASHLVMQPRATTGRDTIVCSAIRSPDKPSWSPTLDAENRVFGIDWRRNAITAYWRGRYDARRFSAHPFLASMYAEYRGNFTKNPSVLSQLPITNLLFPRQT